MTLTIYSPDFDTDCCRGGFSGRVFLDGDGEVEGFGAFDNLQEALKFALEVGLKLDAVAYLYREGGCQMFVKLPFSITGSAVGSNPTSLGSSPSGASNGN